ncbi:MAG: DUF1972 domain-containing protein [Eubacterium sp.]|nr:DUF1972 domain-containing protein [Eubacterium sp.]
MTDKKKSRQHVFICGSKSIGQYGGYETFVDKLSEYLQDDSEIRLHIACKANGDGCMDESRLENVTAVNEHEFRYHNAHCFKIEVPEIGSAAAIWYDITAIRACIAYCRKFGIRRPVFYILACRIGPFIAELKREIRKLDGILLINPDGHEWKRAKWPAPVRRYWKYSERLMVKHADYIVCDSVHIEQYIQEEYRSYHPQTTYISYGSEIAEQTDGAPQQSDAYAQWLWEQGLAAHQYYLVVGRFVPENNYYTMIREFMQSQSDKSFALITNVNQDFLEELEEKLHFRKDPRIRFVGTVYDPALLREIRQNAYAYFHGHEVGGTNPSLLEALGATDLNLLLDVGFNREVAENAALYWSKDPGSLAGLIDYADRLSEEEIRRYGSLAKERIRRAYSWEKIAEAYRKLLRRDIHG